MSASLSSCSLLINPHLLGNQWAVGCFSENPKNFCSLWASVAVEIVGCPESRLGLVILPRHPLLNLSLSLIGAISDAPASAVKELTFNPGAAVPFSCPRFNFDY